MSVLTGATPGARSVRIGLWPSVWKLLRLQLIITINNIRRSTGRRKVGYVIMAVIVLGALVGLFAISHALLGLLQNPSIEQYISFNTVLVNAPIWIMLAAFMGLLITSFGVMLQSLYLSGDMEFLLAAPVPIRAVFVAKLIEAILPNFGLVCLFGLPVLFGLGSAARLSFVFYPLVILAFATLALASAGLSSLLVMAVVRIFPARRVAELLGFLGAIISLLCSQSGQFSNSLHFNPDQANHVLGTLTHLSVPWSPFTWAGRGLIDLATGQWLPGFLWSGFYFGLAGGIFFLALVVAERLYYTGWSRVQVGGRRRKRERAVPASAQPAPRSLSLLFGRISPPVRGIIWKDLRMLTRDLRNMSQLITPILFGVIYAFTLARSGGYYGRGEAPEVFNRVVKAILVDANVGLALFVSWSLITRLALMGFSQEGRHYWILKVAPVSAGKLLWAKFWVAYLLPVGMGSIFLALISLIQGASIDSIVYGLMVILFSLAGAVGVNLAFGVTGANFTWENPRRMVQGTAGCTASLVSMGYMVAIIALFFGPPIVLEALGLPGLIGRLAGLLLGIPASLVCAIWPPLSVRARLEHIGEG